MILVTGANGITGHAVISKLVAKGAMVRALVRNPAYVEKIRSLGAYPVVGNMRDVGSLRQAMKGVRAVYHIPPRTQEDELQLGKNAIEAAKSEKVQYFVYHSVFPHLEEIWFHREKMKVEMEVIHSNLPFTIIEPSNYMQNIDWTWNWIIEKGQFLMPYSSEQPVTWVDVEDTGEAAANVLTQPGHDGATYQISGTKPMNRHELAAIISNILGREVKATTMPIDEYVKLPHLKKRTPWGIEALKTMYKSYDTYGFHAGNPKVLEMLLGRKPTSYDEFFRRFLRLRMGDKDVSCPGWKWSVPPL